MATNDGRRMAARTMEGTDVLVNTEPGELFLDIPAGSPRYVRVEEGGTVREGDIRSHREEELESPRIRAWTIETIGRETVVGTERRTGERREWDRETLERRLATGGLSTDLTDFERVNVTEQDDDESGERSVLVVAYGNDGRKFSETFRPVRGEADADERRLEPTGTDDRVGEFEPDLRKRFDRAVELALRNEGYAV